MTYALIERFRKFVNDHPELSYQEIDRRAKLCTGHTASIVQKRINQPSRHTLDRIQRFLAGVKPFKVPPSANSLGDLEDSVATLYRRTERLATLLMLSATLAILALYVAAVR